MNKNCGSVKGGDEIFLLCDKVQKGNPDLVLPFLLSHMAGYHFLAGELKPFSTLSVGWFGFIT